MEDKDCTNCQYFYYDMSDDPCIFCVNGNEWEERHE